jgi:RimJ/RimL family protein N-acetyltransferase
MLRFESMSSEEFAEYKAQGIKRYAEEKIRSGNWEKEGGLLRAQLEFETMLPDGLKSKDNFLCFIVDDDKEKFQKRLKIGRIWYALNVPDSPGNKSTDLFIYDFEIFEDFRGKGYAMMALQLLEQEARKLGRQTISLHVFGQNYPARRLYQKCGYVESNVMMSKRVA